MVARGFVCCALVLAGTASARADSQADVARCKDLYRVAEFTRAIDVCKQAYLETSDPRLLFTIAQVYRGLDDPENAVRFYHQFLDANPSYPSDKRTYITKVYIQPELDEMARRFASAPTAPTTAVSPPASRPTTPRPSEPAAAPATSVAPVTPPALPTASRRHGSVPILAAGILGVGGGATLAIIGYLTASSATAAPTLDGFEARSNDGRLEQAIGAGAIVAGAGLLAVDVWIAHRDGAPRDEGEVEVVPLSHGAALELGGSF